MKDANGLELCYLGDLRVRIEAERPIADLGLIYICEEALACSDWPPYIQSCAFVLGNVLAALREPPDGGPWVARLAVFSADYWSEFKCKLVLADGRLISCQLDQAAHRPRIRIEPEHAEAMRALIKQVDASHLNDATHVAVGDASAPTIVRPTALPQPDEGGEETVHEALIPSIDFRWFDLDAPEPTKEGDLRLHCVAARRDKAAIRTMQTCCGCGALIWSTVDLGGVVAALWGVEAGKKMAESLAVCTRCARRPRKEMMKRARAALMGSIELDTALMAKAATLPGDEDVSVVGTVGTVRRMQDESRIEFAMADLATAGGDYLLVAFDAGPRAAVQQFNPGDKARASGRLVRRALSHMPAFRGFVRTTAATLIERKDVRWEWPSGTFGE